MFAILAENQERKAKNDVLRIWATPPWQARLLNAFQQANPGALVQHGTDVAERAYVLSIYNVYWQISRPATWIDKAHGVSLKMLRQADLSQVKSRYSVVAGSAHVAAELVITPDRAGLIPVIFEDEAANPFYLGGEANKLAGGLYHLRMTWEGALNLRQRYEQAEGIRDRLHKILFNAQRKERQPKRRKSYE